MSELSGALTRIRRGLRSQMRQRTGPRRWSPAQMELLSVVAGHPGIGIKEASALLHVAPNTVSTLVGQLTDLGDLQRRAASDDGRAALLHLAPESSRRIARWRRERDQHLLDAIAVLPRSEQRDLHAAIPALVHLAIVIERASPDR